MNKHKPDHPCHNCGFGARSIEDIRNKDYSNYYIRKTKENHSENTDEFGRYRMNKADAFLSILLGLSDNDKKRLYQCITCKHDPEACGCDESNEDEQGMCIEWIGDTE